MKRQQSNGTWITFDGDDGDKLYFCDPAKNIRCSKTGCHTTCFHTTNEEFGLFTPEKPKLSDICSTADEIDAICKVATRKDSPCITCEQRKTCMGGTGCGKFQTWFRDEVQRELFNKKLTTEPNKYTCEDCHYSGFDVTNGDLNCFYFFTTPVYVDQSREACSKFKLREDNND